MEDYSSTQLQHHCNELSTKLKKNNLEIARLNQISQCMQQTCKKDVQTQPLDIPITLPQVKALQASSAIIRQVVTRKSPFVILANGSKG